MEVYAKLFHVTVSIVIFCWDHLLSYLSERQLPFLPWLPIPSYTGLLWWSCTWVGFTLFLLFYYRPPILLGQMGVWQNWLDSLERWWNIRTKVNITQVPDHQSHPVLNPVSVFASFPNPMLRLQTLVQSGASYLSQGFVMFFHASCKGLPGQ